MSETNKELVQWLAFIKNKNRRMETFSVISDASVKFFSQGYIPYR